MLVFLIVYRMEFDKTKWSCPWNSDQNCTQNSARGWLGSGVGVKGVVEVGVRGWWGQGGRGWWGQGVGGGGGQVVMEFGV